MKAIYYKHQELVYVFHTIVKYVQILHHMHQVNPVIKFLIKQKN
jgi:hypothetical protein